MLLNDLSGVTIVSTLCVLLMAGLIVLGTLHILTERRIRRAMYSDNEKDALFDTSRPTTPVPEIRLTFPDDAETNPSKEVIVQVSEAGCAFVRDVPKHDGFKELNLDDIGGLRE